MKRRWIMAAVVLAAGAGLAAWMAQPAVQHQTETVRRHDVEASVTAIGTLQPRRFVDVGAQVSGQIRRLHVAAGDTVRQGQLLVEIDPSVQQAVVDAGRAQLQALRAQLAEEEAQWQRARDQAARQLRLDADGATRGEDVQAARAELAVRSARLDQWRAQIAQTRATQRADEARLGYTRIYAPMDGTVIGVEAREGQTLNATYQTPRVLRLADLATMTVWTEVSEADIGRVRAGMPASFTTLGGEGQAQPRRWHSRVRQVLPAPPLAEKGADAAAAPAATKAVTYTVLFDVDNADGALLPQMTAQVGLRVAHAPRALAVPLSALQPVPGDPERAQVRVLDPRAGAQAREVQLGVRSRHLAEVTKGLAEGEQLIVGETRQARWPAWLQW
ncbi:macrolide-specific efflux system membrane fusion protein [Pseudacidovorax intermedius]|uniref:Macrolide-specific efflux system membrane fusion protein n=1 Tax=Pseudacidovorax intermedius TaxID=433924 RepID=A0A370F7Z3_9BURK|nr:efflux RND transporter periplasmic adaptor subunit [Pseudacidovorax intermedius]RDI17745.1 macrolide-specific efflux system membrane fusion protein [Pseudacidovorax intermedius]